MEFLYSSSLKSKIMFILFSIKSILIFTYGMLYHLALVIFILIIISWFIKSLVLVKPLLALSSKDYSYLKERLWNVSVSGDFFTHIPVPWGWGEAKWLVQGHLASEWESQIRASLLTHYAGLISKLSFEDLLQSGHWESWGNIYNILNI